MRKVKAETLKPGQRFFTDVVDGYSERIVVNKQRSHLLNDQGLPIFAVCLDSGQPCVIAAGVIVEVEGSWPTFRGKEVNITAESLTLDTEVGEVTISYDVFKEIVEISRKKVGQKVAIESLKPGEHFVDYPGNKYIKINRDSLEVSKVCGTNVTGFPNLGVNLETGGGNGWPNGVLVDRGNVDVKNIEIKGYEAVWDNDGTVMFGCHFFPLELQEEILACFQDVRNES